MRFSNVFDPQPPMRAAQGCERGEDAHSPAAGTPPAAPQEVPDDLDQRVRQIGEWQLEDW
jgi:hypothetical protein